MEDGRCGWYRAAARIDRRVWSLATLSFDPRMTPGIVGVTCKLSEAD